jgi:hypothetical protein
MRHGLITYAILLLPLAAALLMVPHGSLAQNTTDRETTRNALEVTDDVIREASEVVTEARSQKGTLKLAVAVQRQKQAWNSFVALSNRMAMQLTLEARKEAQQAIGLARLDIQTQERLDRVIEETIDRIVKVRDIMIEFEIRAEHPRKLLDESRNLIEKSRLNAHQYRYQLALDLAQNGRERAVRAEQEVRVIRILKERIERRLTLLERLLERARERVHESQDERARNQLRMAEEQFNRARELVHEGRYRAAGAMTEKCEKTLRSLIRQISSWSLSDPQTRLDEAYQLLERTEEMISESRKDAAANQAQMWYEQAKEMLLRAEEGAAANRVDEAIRFIEEAKRLLRRAIDEVQEGLDESRVTATIEAVEEHREQILAAIGDCDAAGVRTLMQRADDRLSRARIHLGNGDYQAADAEARIARNLYDRIREACSF